MKQKNRLTFETELAYCVTDNRSSEVPLVNPLYLHLFADSRLYPLYSAHGTLIGEFPESELLHMAGVELLRNRRGHVKRARLVPLTCVVDISHGRAGMHRIQTLACGRIHALCGTTGCEDDDV